MLPGLAEQAAQLFQQCLLVPRIIGFRASVFARQEPEKLAVSFECAPASGLQSSQSFSLGRQVPLQFLESGGSAGEVSFPVAFRL